MLTTTDTIPFKIIKIVGLVTGTGSGTAAFSVNHEEVDRATSSALKDMNNAAKKVGANAIIGIKISIGGTNATVLASAIGTAIVYDPQQPL